MILIYYILAVIFTCVLFIRELFLFSGRYCLNNFSLILKKNGKQYAIKKVDVLVLQIEYDNFFHKLYTKKDNGLFVLIRIRHQKNPIPVRIADEETIKLLIANFECRRDPNDFLFRWEK